MKRKVMLAVYLFLIALFSFFLFWDYDDVFSGVDDAGIPGIFNELEDAGGVQDSLCGNNYCDDNAGEDGVNCPTDCVTECNDLVDNDIDGSLDLDDSDCSDANDNSESSSSSGGGGGGGSGGGSDGSGGDSGSDPFCGDGTCDSNEDGNSCRGDCVTQCNDFYDNDDDGFIDYPNDTGCSDLNDNSEFETGEGSYDENLIAYYQFENNSFDSSGKGYDGTNNGGIFDSDSKVGSYSLSLDGSSSYVALPSEINLSGSSTTIAFWFKANNVNGLGRFISKANGVQDDEHWWKVGLNNSQLEGLLKTSSSTSQIIGGSLSTETWTHGVMIYNGSEMRLYVDGSQVAMQVKTGAIDVDDSIEIWIGANPDGTNYYDGLIDDLRIYNRSLSNEEIADLAGISTCTPDCTNLACGNDGCGGSCGACQSGEYCSSGVCTSFDGIPAEVITTWAYPDSATVANTAYIGVVAYHRRGVGRVDFTLNGQTTSITQETINPETDEMEFVFQVDTTQLTDDTSYTITATAYPFVQDDIPKTLP
ncbi:MAG: LamG domain-containing protein [Candidatus Nanoarchaeia archaeon]|nr:LamG domain-containing protein [Candidatus Nanoarchaeia archaeon]